MVVPIIRQYIFWVRFEEHIDLVFVVAWDMDDEKPHPRAFEGEAVIMLLIAAVKQSIDGD